MYLLCLQLLAAAGLPKQIPQRKVGTFVYLTSTAAAAVPALASLACFMLNSEILLLQEHTAISMAEQICLGTLAAILIGELLSCCKCSFSTLCSVLVAETTVQCMGMSVQSLSVPARSQTVKARRMSSYIHVHPPMEKKGLCGHICMLECPALAGRHGMQWRMSSASLHRRLRRR